jgi:NAD(P)-dependent dehydrogenase (short-subunit alcohol dehydrogenase family)
MTAVLVTGSAKRIGAEIVRRFAKEGWTVFIHTNSSMPDAAALAEELNRGGAKAFVLQLDLSDPAKFSMAISTVIQQAPDLCALVNNASIFEFDSAQRPDRDIWARALMVNAYAPALLSAEFARQTAKGTQRSVINILDQKLVNLNPDFFSYTASKAALAAITTMTAMTFGPEIKVVNVAAGLTLPSAGQTEAEFAKVASANLLKRRTHPSEIADAVWFAATGPISTAQTIFVDSGQRFLPLERDIMFQSHREP